MIPYQSFKSRNIGNRKVPGCHDDEVKSLNGQNTIVDKIFDDNFKVVCVGIVFDAPNDGSKLDRLFYGSGLVAATCNLNIINSVV